MFFYRTKTLVEMHPNHPVEIRTQIEQTSDENWDPKMEEKVWYCTSSRSHTTISKYAEYQAETIKEHFSKAVSSLHYGYIFIFQEISFMWFRKNHSWCPSNR